jgi:hypothetical protein
MVLSFNKENLRALKDDAEEVEKMLKALNKIPLCLPFWKADDTPLLCCQGPAVPLQAGRLRS